MSRQQFNDGQEVIFQDFNKMGARVENQFYDRVIYEMLQRAENALFDDGFLVSYASPSSVSVNAGVGFQTDNTQVSPEPKKRLLYRAGSTTLNLVAPDLVNDRIDIVVMRAARVSGATESRKFKDAGTLVISNQNLVTSNDWESEFDIVEGTPAGSPVAPATPSGWIKISELYVNAVTGLSGAIDVDDTRTLMPVGGSATINSLAFVRLTQSAGLTIQQACAEIDAFLKNGYQEYTDYDVLGADPAVPAVSKVRLYHKGGVWYSRENGGTITPLGSGAGGGSGAEWLGDAFEATENGAKTKQFAQGGGQMETLWVKVPQGYLAGRQIFLYLNAYSPSAADQWKFQTVATLIRENQDAVTSVANQRTANSGDIVNAVANRDREVFFDLTSATGQINGFAVSPGDRIKVELTRIVPGGTEDTADIRMVPASTEVKFG
jgi:hypothetical protein